MSWAGTIPAKGPGTSTIAVLAEALQIRNLAISGANGPSIKHPSTGSIRSLAIPSLGDPDITVALEMQESVLREMAPKYEFAEIAYDTQAKGKVARFRKYRVVEFVDELTKGTRWRTWHSISSEYAIRATEFFRVFLEQVERQIVKVGAQPRSMLYSKEDGLTTVYWDGTKVVTGTPPSWPVFVE